MSCAQLGNEIELAEVRAGVGLAEAEELMQPYGMYERVHEYLSQELTHLVASLLDMSRLQAGVVPVFPRPADLGEIIVRSLDGLGPQARAVVIGIPHGSPPVLADPVIMERVIANVTANALRYSPGGLPPLLTASANAPRTHRGDRRKSLYGW